MQKNDTVAKIKDLATLSEVMGEHIKLHRSGRNITCCCPFHDDKSPSMSISDERGFYHCFGCGASGDVFSFMQEYFNIDFKQALKELANRYGVEISPQQSHPKIANDVLILLQERFVAELAKNAQALNYLHSRGFSDESIAAFSLGYAPSNQSTIKLLQKHQIAPATALKQGAVKEKDGKLYASFIERISFPISNENGELIGFGARTLNAQNPAKYVNSPTSALFDKKRILYGFFAAKKTMRREKMLLICEGYLDVIAFHQANIKFAVAVLGVALSQEHLRLIPKDIFVRLCFDSDNAGQMAAFRAASLLARAGYNGDVITLLPHKDAGEFIQANKPAELARAACTAGQNIIAFAMDYIFKNELNITSVSAHTNCDPFIKRKAIFAVLEFISGVDDFLAKQHLELFSKRAKLELAELNTQEIINNYKIAADKSTPKSQSFTPPFASQNDTPKSPQALALKDLANEQINPLESSVFYFLASARKDFGELIYPQYFCASALAQLLKNGEFDHLRVMDFVQFAASTAKAPNVVGFLHNLARVYAQSADGTKQQLYLRYASALLRFERAILGCKEQLKSAYLLLYDINAFEAQNSALAGQIIEKINQLGAK